VVLSHRNMVAGAKSVASYIENRESDVLLAALPLSFDAGFSQLTTAFHAGASVVLLNYLLPKDVVRAVAEHRVTGITAVPPLWIQLTQVTWPAGVSAHLRYFANTGGRMPFETLSKLRALWPQARPYLMYGLTEAFRATYLPPEEVERRPDSIGKAIPNSEVLVLRPDGSPCEPGEPGELVQRGALVAQGYWNDPDKTAERFRPLPGARARPRPSGDRRLFRRHRAPRRARLPVLHRPARRDDQVLGLSHQPERGRGGSVRDRPGRASARPSVFLIRPWARWSLSS
jgi:non-ribosomal peptide synthetase component F